MALALEADREAVTRGHTEAEAAVAAVTVAATAAAAAGAEVAGEAEAAAETETAVAAVEAAVEAGAEAELSDAAREEGSEAWVELGAETRETRAETEPSISRSRSRPRRISWGDEACEEGGETTPVWLQHAAVAVAYTSPDTWRPTIETITTPSAPADTWTSPALGRMITDVQWRLEAAASPDELMAASPDELMAASPDELTAASPDELMAASPDELTAASPKAVEWQVRRRQPTTPPTAILAPAADRHGQSATATPRVSLTSPVTRPTPIRQNFGTSQYRMHTCASSGSASCVENTAARSSRRDYPDLPWRVVRRHVKFS